MVVDEDFINRFKFQVEILRELQKEVSAAIERADKRLEEMQKEMKNK
jgi:hypothetical protein